MQRRITATEAVRTFSEVVNRVRYNGDEYVVERNGEPVCKIVPAKSKKKWTVGDLIEHFKNKKPDPAFADDLEWVVKNRPKLPERDPWS